LENRKKGKSKMHPFHHSLSSQRHHGGAVTDYLPLHNWFDATKSISAFFAHRVLRHHLEGAAEASRLFGSEIVNAECKSVSVHDLAVQHLSEDLGKIATAADWLQHVELDRLPIVQLMPRLRAEDLAVQSAKRFAITPAVVLPVHTWFFETATWFTDERHLIMRNTSWGIFQAEQHFGIVLDDGHNAVPTRIVGEWHVRAVFGRIPAAAEFIRLVKGQRWMAAAQNARRLGLA
jgi:hypothetical protein